MVNKKFQKNPKTVKPNLSVTCQYSESRKKRGEIYFEKERINMKKKVISLLLALCILCGCLPVTVSAADFGELSDTISWRYDQDTKTLYLSGTGATPDFSYPDYMPFYHTAAANAKNIVVEKGITTLGKNLFFSNFQGVESISLPEGLTTIREYSLGTLSRMGRLVLPSTVTTIADYACSYMGYYGQIVIPRGVQTIGVHAFAGFDGEKIEYEGTRAEWDAAFSQVELPEGMAPYCQSELSYTVYFDANGGTVSRSQKELQRYTPYGTLPAPIGGERQQFVGWFTAPSGGTPVSAADIFSSDGNQTLYAHWKPYTSSLSPAAAGTKPSILIPMNNTSAYEGNRANIVRSYVYPNDIGGLTWVMERGDFASNIVVEEYDRNLTLRARKEIDNGFRWGGFYAGATYNFIVFGKGNYDEDDNYPVVTIVKYDKGWNQLGTAELKGANTTKPFDFGSLRCAEAGDILYIHTSHEMYKSDDGKNHQANLTISLRESTMEILGGNCDVGGSGYVSHSFNQFVLVDQEDRLVMLDHGDGYPRSFALTVFEDPASRGVYSGFETWKNVSGHTKGDSFAKFPGKAGDNNTTGRMYDLVETETGYLAAFNYSGKAGEAMEAHLYYYDKATKTGNMWKLGIGSFASNAHFVPEDLNSGYLLWNNAYSGPGISWAHYDSTGKLGQVHTSKEGYVTDCVPVFWNNQVIWPAVQGESGTNGEYIDNCVFFSIDKNDTFAMLTHGEAPTVAGFRDVHESDFFSDAVKWAVVNNITAGTDKTHFSPKESCTRGQAVTFLWRAAGNPEPTSMETKFTDVRAGAYYEKAVRWAVEQGITAGISEEKFSPDQNCTRAQIVSFLHRAAGEPEPVSASTGFSDVKAGDYYGKAVRWAVENGITSGTGADKFSPRANCTRGQIVTFLYRNAKKK